jgi:AcrR family transcriptional regulator
MTVRPMPRAGLTPDVVVATAADLADEIGYDGLTLARLADRLGVAAPSLYKHVDGLPAIRRAVAVLGVRELGATLRGVAADPLVPDAGPRLRSLARAFRDYARRHPGRYAATVRAAAPGDSEHVAASDAALEPVLSVLAELGLTGRAAIDAARGLRSLLHGFVVLESAGGFGIPQDVDRSFERSVDALLEGIAAFGSDRPIESG